MLQQDMVAKLNGIIGNDWRIEGTPESKGVRITLHHDPRNGLFAKTFIGEIWGDETLHIAEFPYNGEVCNLCDEFGLWDKIPQAVWGKSYEQINIEKRIAEIKKEMAWRKEEGAPQIETKTQASKLNKDIRHFLRDEDRGWEFHPIHSLEELHELEARLAEIAK